MRLKFLTELVIVINHCLDSHESNCSELFTDIFRDNNWQQNGWMKYNQDYTMINDAISSDQCLLNTLPLR